MSKPFTRRNKDLVKRRDKTKATFQEIGDYFGITRQVAHTIYKREKSK